MSAPDHQGSEERDNQNLGDEFEVEDHDASNDQYGNDARARENTLMDGANGQERSRRPRGLHVPLVLRANNWSTSSQGANGANAAAWLARRSDLGTRTLQHCNNIRCCTSLAGHGVRLDPASSRKTNTVYGVCTHYRRCRQTHGSWNARSDVVEHA